MKNIKNPKGAGRKSLGLTASISVQITPEQMAWLETQRESAETRSVVIRRLINHAMKMMEP